MAAAVFRTIFTQPDAEAVNSAWDQVQGQLAASFPKTGALMGDAKADVPAFAAFPRAHWQKIWSTNPLERINKEIKRRSRVVGIFPNQASAIRLVDAILADLHDEWQTTDRRYLSEDSMSLLYPERDTITTAELTTGNQHRGTTQSPPLHGTLPKAWTTTAMRHRSSGLSLTGGSSIIQARSLGHQSHSLANMFHGSQSWWG